MAWFTEGHFLKSPVDESTSNPKARPMINSVERDGRINVGEVNEVRETPGWQRVRFRFWRHRHSGPEGDCQIARDEGDEHEQERYWIVAASGSGIKKHGETKIIGYTEDGEGVSLRIQRADVKKGLGSARETIWEASWSFWMETGATRRTTNEWARVSYEQCQ